jgi:hypothetical protein
MTPAISRAQAKTVSVLQKNSFITTFDVQGGAFLVKRTIASCLDRTHSDIVVPQARGSPIEFNKGVEDVLERAGRHGNLRRYGSHELRLGQALSPSISRLMARRLPPRHFASLARLELPIVRASRRILSQGPRFIEGFVFRPRAGRPASHDRVFGITLKLCGQSA